MISVSDLRAGTAFVENGQLFKVLKYEHTKMGRGTATIKVKIKNMRSGTTTEKSFISGARVEDAYLEKKQTQYLYAEDRGSKIDDKKFIFMDPITFEQFNIPAQKIADEATFLKEGMNVSVLFYDNEPLSLELPIKMDFKVIQTDPGVKGNSATNIFKDATLENAVRIKVPLFVQEGDMVRVDTRTREYIERVKF